MNEEVIKTIRLIDEIKKEVRTSIIETVEIPDNIFSCIGVFYQYDVVSDRMRYGAKYKLNGKEHIFEGYINKNQILFDPNPSLRGKEQLLEILTKEFSRSIVELLVPRINQ